MGQFFSAPKPPAPYLESNLSSSAVALAANGVDSEAARKAPWLIVGLGNPGTQYDDTRHNVGFAAIDMLAQSNGMTWGKKLEQKALVATGTIRGTKVLLCKPMTFMNNSGESVAPLAKYYKIPMNKVLVMFDDLDGEAGVVKLKLKGGHGGHNGMRSIIQKFGDQKEFPRVKIGIGRPPGQMPVAAFVLGKFSKAEADARMESVIEANRMAEAICGLGLEMAVSGKRL